MGPAHHRPDSTLRYARSGEYSRARYKGRAIASSYSSPALLGPEVSCPQSPCDPPAASSINPRRPAGSGHPRPPCPQRIRHPLPSRPHAPTHVVPARLTADLRSSGHSQLTILRILWDKRTRSRASVFSRIRSVGIHTPAPSPTSALDRGRDRGEQETQQRPPGDDRPVVAGIRSPRT